MTQTIKPHYYQAAMLFHPARFQVAVWGRRSGKTTGAKYKTALKALSEPGSKIWYVGLTYENAKVRMWDEVNGTSGLIPKDAIAYVDNSSLYVKLKNGSQIWVKGAKTIDNVLGESLDLLVLDEFQSMNMNIWDKLRPMLSDREGEAWIIGTPRGFNHLYELFWKGSDKNPNKAKNWQSWQITTLDAIEEGTGVSLEDVLEAKNDLSPEQYAQEFLASFEAVQGRVYKPFGMEPGENVSELFRGNTKEFYSDLPLRVGMDFNVNPMTATLGVNPDWQTHFVMDELYLPNSGTPEIIKRIKEYASTRRNQTVFVYPDASGKNRSSITDSTNFTLLKEAGFHIVAGASNPRVEDRINEVNRMLLNANGDRRLIIHPNCKELIKSLHSLTYAPDGTPDKSSGFDHITDALGYIIHQEFPIKVSGGTFTRSL